MELIKTLTPLERSVIPKLRDGMTHRMLAKETGLQEVEVMRALQWLGNKKVLSIEKDIARFVHLDAKGEDAYTNGLPERRLLKAAEKKTRSIQELAQAAGIDPRAAGAAMGVLKRNNFITLDKGNITLTANGKKAVDTPSKEELLLKEIATKPQAQTQEHDELVKRGLVKVVETRDNIVKLSAVGKKLITTDLGDAPEERVTPEDLKSGAWKDKEYRTYDVSLNVPSKTFGKKHFVNEAIEYIKQIWLELGFEEMEGTSISTAFWDLDALYVPQDHPAREMQDTFYLGKREAIADKKLYDAIKAVHENGGDTGSTGWQYSFSKEETEQLLLRTHTTVLSAHTLDLIRQGKKHMPGKYFAVGPVFRNEDLDWKHLFEFHQVEGIVVDPNANFRHLLGYLEMFFKKLGYEKVRVRPAHFPYTEPSAEVDGWHPVKKQWVELTGAGMFRPEVTKTLIGKEVPVLAWGIGFERSITDFFGIKDLRELYSNDLKQLQSMKKWMK